MRACEKTTQTVKKPTGKKCLFFSEFLVKMYTRAEVKHAIYFERPNQPLLDVIIQHLLNLAALSFNKIHFSRLAKWYHQIFPQIPNLPKVDLFACYGNTLWHRYLVQIVIGIPHLVEVMGRVS